MDSIAASPDGPLPSAAATDQAQHPAADTPQYLDHVEAAGGSGAGAIVSGIESGTAAMSDPAAPYGDRLDASPNLNGADAAILRVAASYDLTMEMLVMRVYSRIRKSFLDIHA
jgi:hypothetical protein